MSQPVTVVTVLRSGGAYGPEWVWALRRGLNRWLNDYRFACLTDVESLGLWGVPLLHDWPKWWSLVEWWRPGLFEGRVIAVGLDTLAVGDLSELATYDGPLAGISDFYQPRLLASGVMSWTGDEAAHLYETFKRDAAGIMSRFGRMDPWMRTQIPNAERLQNHFPGQIVSLKAHAMKGPPPNARLVCGHGVPKFSEPRAGWAHKEWTRLAA